LFTLLRSKYDLAGSGLVHLLQEPRVKSRELCGDKLHSSKSISSFVLK
jgi:hypothetical protein